MNYEQYRRTAIDMISAGVKAADPTARMLRAATISRALSLVRFIFIFLHQIVFR